MFCRWPTTVIHVSIKHFKFSVGLSIECGYRSKATSAQLDPFTYVAINRRLNEKACWSSHERRHQKSDWSKSLHFELFLSSRLFFFSHFPPVHCFVQYRCSPTSTRAINFRGLSHMLVYAWSWWWLCCFFHLFVHALDLQWKWNLGDLTNELLSKNKQSLINLFIKIFWFSLNTPLNFV